ADDDRPTSYDKYRTNTSVSWHWLSGNGENKIAQKYTRIVVITGFRGFFWNYRFGGQGGHKTPPALHVCDASDRLCQCPVFTNLRVRRLPPTSALTKYTPGGR